MFHSTLTKRIEFSASHRYSHEAWDEATNRQVFGPCFQEHGHNYLLEVTLGGQVDAVTGMIINLYDLKHIVTDVLEEFDHKHLNLDTPYFINAVPTTENIARVLWDKFRHRPDTQNVSKIKLSEGEDLWAEIVLPEANFPLNDPTVATVSRSYHFSAFHRSPSGQPQGWYLTLTTSVNGPIHPITGRVTDILLLDRLVSKHVILPLAGKDLTEDTSFQHLPLTLTTIAETMFQKLRQVIGNQLQQITLQDQMGTQIECFMDPASHPRHSPYG